MFGPRQETACTARTGGSRFGRLAVLNHRQPSGAVVNNDRACVNPRAMIEYIAKEIVEAKAEVIVDEYEDGDETVIELEVAESDLGKVIGRSAAWLARCAIF